MNADDPIVIAYSVSNALRVASYAPQLWSVARDRTGAQAISCLSWNLWTAANATTALYAWTQWRDPVLTLVNAANALGCVAIVLTTLVKRSAYARTATVPTPPSLEIAMTSDPHPPVHPASHMATPSWQRAGAGVLAASIAAAAIVGVVTLLQSTQLGAQAATAVSAASVPKNDIAEPLDAGVDWNRVAPAGEQAGASVAAYER